MRLNSPRMNVIYNACMKASKSMIRDFGEIEKLQVSAKGPGDFVTNADKRAEKIIIEELLKAHPDYGILGEESGAINQNNKTNRWIIGVVGFGLFGISAYVLLGQTLEYSGLVRPTTSRSKRRTKRSG